MNFVTKLLQLLASEQHPFNYPSLEHQSKNVASIGDDLFSLNQLSIKTHYCVYHGDIIGQ